MGNKVNKIVHSRLFVIILIGILILTTILFGTYAWFTWSSTDNTVFNMTIGKVADVTFEGGNAITGNLEPVFNYYDGLSTTFSINNESSSDEGVYYKIDFNITSIDTELIYSNALDIKYTILKGGNILKEGDLAGTNNNTTITLYNGKLDSGVTEYIVYLYIDGNVENYSSMMGKTITGNIVVVERKSSNETLATHITNLYLNNKNADTVENNGISYGYASIYDNDTGTDPENITSGGLMNDRLGTTSIGIDDGNVRYYGANPNNYIYFNCDDYANQALVNSTRVNCELWRIIGVFDGKVKIMRNSFLDEALAWDQDKNQDSTLTTYNNDWSTSSLQEFLNGKYYNRGEDESWTYYMGRDGSLSVSVDLKYQAIKNDETRSLISQSLWYLKGWSSNSIYSNQMYDYERNSGTVYNTSWPTTMPGNIAVPYASDYGYAVDFNSCINKTLDSYDDATCTSTNWMKPILARNYPNTGWLMAPISNVSSRAWRVDLSGSVFKTLGVYYGFGVAPVLYLNSELGIEAGDGSEDSPYKLAVY